MCVCVAIAFRKDVSRCSGSTLTNPVDIKPVQSISSRSAGGQELVVNNNKLLNPIDVPKIHSPLEKGVWPAPSLVTIISQFNIKGMPGNLKNSVQVKHICVHFPLCVLHVGGMDAMINQAHDVFFN